MTRVESPIDHREVTSGNPLANIVEQQIKKSGQIPFDQYMSIGLYGGTDASGVFVPGFYNGDAISIGYNGENNDDHDFRTISEETPLYGYVMANQILDMWKSMDYPSDFRIVEMGAGNGTMASDILHRIQEVETKGEYSINPRECIKYTIIEQGRNLSRKQKDRLSKYGDQVEIVRASAVEPPLAGVTGVVVSVELPDAFPVKKVRLVDDRIQECFIKKGDFQNFEEVWDEPSEEVIDFIHRHNIPLSEKPYPANLNAEKWMESISQMLAKGYVITADYYHHHELGGRVPAVFAAENKGLGDYFEVQSKDGLHLRKDLLGGIDMTTGVDFQVLSNVGKNNGLKTLGFVANTGFLFGLSFDLVAGKIYEASVRMVGDREVSIEGIDAAMASSTLKVLMQSKGIQGGKPHGVRYRFNTDLSERENRSNEFQDVDY